MSNYTLSFDPSSGNEHYSPRSLKQLGAKVCGANLKSLLFDETEGENGSVLQLKPGMELPQEVLKAILSESDNCSPHYLPMILELCENVLRKKVVLKDIDLTNCKSLTDAQFERVMRVKPTTLCVHNCGLLTGRALQLINQFGENLECLDFGNTAYKIIDGFMNTLLSLRPNYLDLPKGLLNTPKLKCLKMLNDMDGETLQRRCQHLRPKDQDVDFLEWLTWQFISKLEHLDLSNTMVMRNPEFLFKAKDTIHFLCLQYAVPISGLNNPAKWNVLKYLTKLRFLDVAGCSITDDDPSVLKNVVENLKSLKYLDLTGNQEITVSENKDVPGRLRIDAFASRETIPLKYICLYAARSTAICKFVPACVVVQSMDFNLYHLTKLIMEYNDKMLPNEIMKFLKLISNERLSGQMFSWKKTINWVLQAVEENLIKFQSRHPIYKLMRFFNEAMSEPLQLETYQLHKLFKCLVNLLRLEWDTTVEIGRIFDAINMYSNIKDVPTTQIYYLLPALVRSIRTVVKINRDGSTEEKTESTLYIQRIETYLQEKFKGDVEEKIQSEALKEEIVALNYEVNRLHPPPNQVNFLVSVLREKFMG